VELGVILHRLASDVDWVPALLRAAFSTAYRDDLGITAHPLAQRAQLAQQAHAVVEGMLVDDLAVLELEGLHAFAADLVASRSAAEEFGLMRYHEDRGIGVWLKRNISDPLRWRKALSLGDLAAEAILRAGSKWLPLGIFLIPKDLLPLVQV
jgi:hypothetical protein